MSKLSQADADLLARVARAQKVTGTAANDLLVGTSTTWAAFSDLTVEQALVVARQWAGKQDELRRMAAAKAKADAEKAAAEAEKVAAEKKKAEEERLAGEEAKRRGPHAVTDTAALMGDEEGFWMFCNQDREQDEAQAQLPWNEWQKSVDLKVWTTSNYFQFKPVSERLGLKVPKDASNHIDGFSYFSERGKSLFQDGRIVMVVNWNADVRATRDIQAYFDHFRSSEVIAESTLPAADDGTKDEVTYRFSLEGPSSSGPRKVDLLCKARRPNQASVLRTQMVREARAAAEASRPRSPNERLIEQIEAKGGSCMAVGQHLRTFLGRAEQDGDWSRFREELGRGASYGC